MKREDFKKIQQPEGFISASPSPTQDELQKFYSDLYYQKPQSSTYQTSYEEIELYYKRLKCDSLIYALKKLGIAGGRFLDIGAGEGFLMNAAMEQGFMTTGIDFSSFGIEKFHPSLKNQLVVGDVYESIYRFKSEGYRFIACSAINVLEHVIDPHLFLSEICEILDPNGVLAITVPNDFSVLQKMLLDQGFIDREFWFGPPQHLHYFNAQNLPGFCISNGYKLLDAFSDFPIELYLFHPGSNYVTDPKRGPSAHRARMLHDLLIAQEGLEKYLNFYRSMFQVGIGRDITILLSPVIK